MSSVVVGESSKRARKRRDGEPPTEPTQPPVLYRIAPDGTVNFFFHLGQAQVFNSDARFVLMAAGSQSGKTSFGPWWLEREIRRCGAGDYLAVTTNFDLFSKKMLPEMLNVFVNVLQMGRYWPSLRTIELCEPNGKFWARRQDDPMWARIMLHSVEAESGLEASTANAAWLDELGQDGWDITHWEAIQRRLAIKRGRALGTTTVYNMGWLKSEWYDRWQMGDLDFDVVQFDSTENPSFPREEFERQRRIMPAWRFAMFYRGMFEHPEHMIYGAYHDEIGADGHLVEDFAVPDAWRRVVGVDFGGANHCELTLAEDSETHIWYVIREALGGGRTVNELARDAVERYAKVSSIVYVGGAKGESQNRRDWAANGMPVKEPPIEDVELGIDRVTRMFKEDRLRVFKSLSGLRSELRSYRRKLDESTGKPTDDIVAKSTFHRLDALRYAALYVVERLWGGADLNEQLKRYAAGTALPDNSHLPMPSEVGVLADMGMSTIPSFNTMELGGGQQRRGNPLNPFGGEF